jgi:hypothetical protein
VPVLLRDLHTQRNELVSPLPLVLESRFRTNGLEREIHILVAKTQFMERIAKHLFFFALHVRYHNGMKPPPDDPQFRKFTDAMRTIMSVSKTELKKREAEEKKEKQPSAASPDSASSSKPR